MPARNKKARFRRTGPGGAHYREGTELITAARCEHLDQYADHNRAGPNVHPSLEIQLFILDVLPAPNVGIEHADETKYSFQKAFLLE